jgi:molybdenum cofactor cytidylyltransferase
MKQCLMLAAGLSSRMGQWKMLLPWGDNSCVLDSALDNALAFCERVVLVTGFQGETLRQRYASRPGVVLCHNPDYVQGMFSSLRCGARALTPGHHFFMVPGDMPAIHPGIYAALWRHRGNMSLVPFCNGGRGHPVLLPPILREHILNAGPQDILRQLMERQGRKTLLVDSHTIHQDLDTPSQYREAYERLTPGRTF